MSTDSVSSSTVVYSQRSNTIDNFYFSHANIRSLFSVSNTGSRLDELKYFMNENKIVVMALGAVHKVCHAPEGGGGLRKCDSL